MLSDEIKAITVSLQTQVNAYNGSVALVSKQSNYEYHA